MPDTETLDIPLSGIKPDLQLPLNSGKLTYYPPARRVDKSYRRRHRNPMHYTQLFRQLREARNLSYEALARRAGCHRNTVINVENGRPVKFGTLAELMGKMGYPLASDEMRALALLWLEALSGISFSRAEITTAARKQAATYGRGAQHAAGRLVEAVIGANLTVEQIRLLVFAARQPEVLTIIEAVRDLVESAAAEDSAPQLKVAEDK